MKQIFSKTTEKFILTAYVTPDNMKLFLDVSLPEETPDPEEEPHAEPTPAKEGEAAPAADAAAPKATETKAPPPTLVFRNIKRQDVLDVVAEIVKTDKVNLGVIDDIIEYLKRGEKAEKRRILKGEEPQKGIDGRLVYLVKRFTGEVGVAIDQRGFANYAELHLFDNIEKGQILARIYPPKQGVDGTDIFGAKVAAPPGAEAAVRFDKSIVRRKETMREGQRYEVLVAENDGYLEEVNGELQVKDRLEIKGDIDYHCGNIDFIGSVHVKGDVLAGFRVRAQRGIDVDGSVKGGSLFCPHGNITVKGLVVGKEEEPDACIVCGQDFTAKGLHEARVETRGDITIQRASHTSQVRTQGEVVMKDGKLIGGDTYVAVGVEAKRIGNETGAHTTIHLCSDIQTSTEYYTLVVGIESHDKAITLMKSHLGPLVKNPERIEELPREHRDKVRRLIEKLEKVSQSRERLIAKKEAMLVGAKTRDVLQVNYLQKMFRGTVVRGGTKTYEVGDVMDGPATLVYNTVQDSFAVASALVPLPGHEGEGAAEGMSKNKKEE